MRTPASFARARSLEIANRHMIQICKPEKAAKSLAANPERAVLMPKFVMAFSNGGTTQLPVLQHVTTTCHHCLEPPCLEGCPVLAYEKDATTGIVRHLDDQCIGCQYCILKCPYDVPKYSHSKGIVRKCDMCSDRLAADEAPACVQACPSQAIRISIVNQQQVIEECESNVFLPGVPEPEYTLPTTIYKSRRVMPRNVLPADYYNSRPAHAHTPLIVMLEMEFAALETRAARRQGHQAA